MEFQSGFELNLKGIQGELCNGFVHSKQTKTQNQLKNQAHFYDEYVKLPTGLTIVASNQAPRKPSSSLQTSTLTPCVNFNLDTF